MNEPRLYRQQTTSSLPEVKPPPVGGGALEKYSGVNALKPFIDMNLVLERMVPFRLPGGQAPAVSS